MSYRWAFAGIVSAPVATLTEDQLIGIPSRHPLAEDSHFAMRVDGHAVPWRGLVLRRVVMLVQVLKGPSRGVACFDGQGNRIGFSFERLSMVEPQWRGKGLGAELMAENYLLEPQILRERAVSMMRLSWSVAGEAAARRAYRLMLERGAVVQPSQVGVGSGACVNQGTTPSSPSRSPEGSSPF